LIFKAVAEKSHIPQLHYTYLCVVRRKMISACDEGKVNVDLYSSLSWTHL